MRSPEMAESDLSTWSFNVLFIILPYNPTETKTCAASNFGKTFTLHLALLNELLRAAKETIA